MSTVKKPTQRTQFEALIDLATKANRLDLVDFCKGRIEQLDKKNAKSSDKLTPTQIANEGIKKAIADGMKLNRLYTVTEIQKEIPGCAEMSNQRVSSLLRQMKDEGIVIRTEDKRKAYFSLAE
jgi:hypothetical protein